ncbi:MAG TPA: radical SAM protein, partial [Polyangia bacterium]
TQVEVWGAPRLRFRAGGVVLGSAGMDAPLLLADLPWPSFREVVAAHGVSEVVARRLFSRVHHPARAGGADIEEVLASTPGLLRQSRLSLRSAARLPTLTVVERRQASDGFVKYLFRLEDGAAVEAVRIPLPDPEDARALKDRRRAGLAAPLEALPARKYVVCVSSQVGCALACDFCATGRLGAIRNLRTWEILEQVRLVAREGDHDVRGVVFMGMGEPFLNYDNVIGAARVFSDPAGFAIASKAITISTAGVVPMIRRYTRDGHRYRLIVSLGAPDSAQRLPLMPIERRWPLPELMEAVRDYVRATGDRMTFAYVAIGGVNVSPAHAETLVGLLAGLKAKISLIDVSDETGAYHPPGDEEIACFRAVLGAAGIPVVRRYSGGKDIGAACGTLSASQQGGQLVALRR